MPNPQTQSGGEQGASAAKTFVSHASEDKPMVKNLVDTLIRYGVDAWYDDYEIDLGESIRDKINEGLRRSKYGLVILSPNFFAKDWPKQELAALAIILRKGSLIPVFHNVTPRDVATYDPLLADIKGITVPPGDIRQAVVPIARKIRGTEASEATGRMTVHRGRTISIASLPLDETQAIHDVVFEDCILQGIAMINLAPERRFTLEGCYFNDMRQFTVLQTPYAIVGAYGVNNVEFRRCRFKDVGFITSQPVMEIILDTARPMAPDTGFPPHLL